jgi:hypothetical protein
MAEEGTQEYLSQQSKGAEIFTIFIDLHQPHKSEAETNKCLEYRRAVITSYEYRNNIIKLETVSSKDNSYHQIHFGTQFDFGNVRESSANIRLNFNFHYKNTEFASHFISFTEHRALYSRCFIFGR